jgi:hypothetical protein
MSQENVEIVRRFFDASARVGEAYWKKPYSYAAMFQAGTLPPETEDLMSFVHQDGSDLEAAMEAYTRWLEGQERPIVPPED